MELDQQGARRALAKMHGEDLSLPSGYRDTGRPVARRSGVGWLWPYLPALALFVFMAIVRPIIAKMTMTEGNFLSFSDLGMTLIMVPLFLLPVAMVAALVMNFLGKRTPLFFSLAGFTLGGFAGFVTF